MSHTPHKPLPAGCSNQGRYLTRADGYDTEPVLNTYRNGQPITAEPCTDVGDAADIDPPRVKRHPLDGVWGALALVGSAVVAVMLLGHAVAWAFN